MIVKEVVVHERTHRQPIERLWRAFTEPAELATWLMANHARAPVGQRFRFDGGDRLGVVDVDVVETIPPDHLVWEWTFHGQRSRVTVDLTKANGATSLRLEHWLVGADEAPGFDSGWADKLDHDLAALLRENAGQPKRSSTAVRPRTHTSTT